MCVRVQQFLALLCARVWSILRALAHMNEWLISQQAQSSLFINFETACVSACAKRVECKRPFLLLPGFLWLCEGRTLCPASSRSEEISPSPSTNRKLPPRDTLVLSREEEGGRELGKLMLVERRKLRCREKQNLMAGVLVRTFIC